MKVLIYSDLHLYNHHRLLVNSETALKLLSYLKDYALQNHIETVISAGDFFHTKARAYAPHVIQGWLRVKDISKAGLKQYMIIGNHDMANPNNTMNSILFMYSDYAKIVPDYFYVDFDNTRVHLLSYSPQMFENFIMAEDKKNVLIGHLDIQGFIMPNGFKAKSGFKVEDFKDFDLVITGHYHKHQFASNIVYVGSPYQTSWAEKDQAHGFLVLDTETATWDFIEYTEAPKYKVIEVRKVKELVARELKDNFIKFKLLSPKINKNKLKDTALQMGAASVEIIPSEDLKEIEKYYDDSFSTEPDDIAKSYLESVSDLQLDKQELMKTFAKIGEVANKITDYEV